jgi:hypothetical protein
MAPLIEILKVLCKGVVTWDVAKEDGQKWFNL